MKVTRHDLETIIYGVRSNTTLPHPGLDYVRVEPGRLVATDGHILIVREIEHNGKEFEPFSVSVPDIKSALKANAELWKTNGRAVTLDPGDDFMARIGRKRVAKQDASYPDWERVIVKKSKRGAQAAAFHPEKMMKVLQGMKDLGVTELRIWGTDSAARFDGKTADGRKVMALVMPVVNVVNHE